jgi:hypothetical protein
MSRHRTCSSPWRRWNIVFGAVLLGAVSTSAFAQSSPAQPAPPASPARMVIEQIQSGWLFAPDARATDLDGKTGALAGGYLGRITDRSWVIGAGGYFLTNREDDFKLAYGGPVFEYLVRADRKIGFGVRTLVGAGTATMPRAIGDLIDPRVRASNTSRRGAQRSNLRTSDPNATIAVHDDFFVAEPQLNVMWNISSGQRLVFGVGYRAVGNAALLGDQLNGVSGSVSFQIGGK